MTKAQLDALFVKLEQDFPDSSTTLTVENFVDWLSKYQFESDLQTACFDALLDKQRKAGLSPTGRRPSQPELQHLPRSYQLPAMTMNEEHAKELLQQYRDTFGPHPWHFPNFPCVHVDLASGVDYSVEQRPIQADHANIDDKGNVSVSTLGATRKFTYEQVMDKKPCYHMYINGRCMACRDKMPKYNPPRPAGANPLLGAPYGKSRYDKDTMTGPTFRATLEEVRQQTWGNMTPDEIYKDLAEAMKKVRAPAEQLIQHRLTQTWTISHGATTISYAPNSAADIPVLLMTELLDNGVVEVVESWKGDAAVKQARYYLELHERSMKR